MLNTMHNTDDVVVSLSDISSDEDDNEKVCVIC